MRAYYALFTWLPTELFLRIVNAKINTKVICKGKPAFVWNPFPDLWLPKPCPDVIAWLWILDVLFAESSKANIHSFCKRSAKGKKQLCIAAEYKSKQRWEPLLAVPIRLSSVSERVGKGQGIYATLQPKIGPQHAKIEGSEADIPQYSFSSLPFISLLSP